jgi:hypothetical protein
MVTKDLTKNAPFLNILTFSYKGFFQGLFLEHVLRNI